MTGIHMWLFTGVLSAILDARSWDAQMSEGKALSDREQAVQTCVGKCAISLDTSNEQLGHAQRIGHIPNRLQLTDRNRLKA